MKTETVGVPDSKRRHFRPTGIRPVRRDPGLQVCSGLHEGEQASFSVTKELGCSDRTISLTYDTCWFILYLVSSDGSVLSHGTHLSFCVPMTIQESRVESCRTRSFASPGWTILAPHQPPSWESLKVPSIGRRSISLWVQMAGVCFSFLFCVFPSLK